jgi:hypothetical protein
MAWEGTSFQARDPLLSPYPSHWQSNVKLVLNQIMLVLNLMNKYEIEPRDKEEKLVDFIFHHLQ